MSVSAAIVGSGNIGTDLMYKLCRSEVIEPRYMVGADPGSAGLERARKIGLEVSADGVDWLLARPELPDVVFEATSAAVHRRHHQRYVEAGIRAVDLTPAAVGPYVIPSVNLGAHLDSPNVNMVTCGGQATIPMVFAVARVVPVPYAEIVATVASVSAGPGTRQNIDEFTRTTANAVEVLGQARRGKAIILNPAEPPLIMRDTIFVQIPDDVDVPAVTESIESMVAEVSSFVPGYRLRQPPQFEQEVPGIGCSRVAIFIEVEGVGDFLPPYAGNLDIMTAAAAKVGEEIGARMPREGSMTRYSAELDVRVTDSSLRDGSHAQSHRFSESDVVKIVGGLDAVGVPVIEVSHGDGLGGSSFTYGFSATDERVLMHAAVQTAQAARIAALMLPGVGTLDDVRALSDLGVRVIRIATHCTEADIAVQHFGLAREVGLETVGFLMMAHSQPPEVLACQARVMVDAGCQCVYVVDSAGALVLEQVEQRVAALVAELGSEAQVGFHGHDNLGLGVANSLLAVRAGAVQIDACTCRFGAGAGNTPTEAFVAVCDKLGISTGIDTLAMFDVAEDVVRPIMTEEPTLSRLALIMGYAGVYSSFLRHAYRAADRYGVSGADILMECGARRLVGGQEDQILDIAIELARRTGDLVGGP